MQSCNNFIGRQRFTDVGQLSVDVSGPAGLAVKPLDLHVVSVGSIPTGPTTAAPWGHA